MKLLIVAGTIIVPVLMLVLQWTSITIKRIMDGLVIVCAFITAITIAFVVQQSISSDTVFTTDVHKVFHNKVFLLASSYLGLYGLYRMLLGLLREYRKGD
ncbi:MAG: hypothetical protein K0R67_1899 [Paenibacillus sp.]|jgi:hypothetical protein|nr:hypothetical protein [Paenibacillus sp.]